MRERIEAIDFYVRKLDEAVEAVSYVRDSREKKVIKQTVSKVLRIRRTLTKLLSMADEMGA